MLVRKKTSLVTATTHIPPSFLVSCGFRHPLQMLKASPVAATTSHFDVHRLHALSLTIPPARSLSSPFTGTLPPPRPKLQTLIVCLVGERREWSRANPRFRDDSNPSQVWLQILGRSGSDPLSCLVEGM
jgi:hypothetical protein